VEETQRGEGSKAYRSFRMKGEIWLQKAQGTITRNEQEAVAADHTTVSADGFVKKG